VSKPFSWLCFPWWDSDFADKYKQNLAIFKIPNSIHHDSKADNICQDQISFDPVHFHLLFFIRVFSVV
jgi:hypothetical protein